MWILSDKNKRKKYQSHSNKFSSLRAEKLKLLLYFLKVWAIIACYEHLHNQAVINGRKRGAGESETFNFLPEFKFDPA